MTLDEAKTLLDACEREELRDHAFGDREVSWFRKGVTDARGERIEVASGYQGGGSIGVSFSSTEPPPYGESRKCLASFKDDNARALFSCGTLVRADRNDETGDDNIIWRP
jgi:hypothetical protein